MSEFNPTTNQVRTAWTLTKVPRLPNEGAGYGGNGTADEFDRWLKGIQREAWDEGYWARVEEREPLGPLDIVDMEVNPYE